MNFEAFGSGFRLEDKIDELVLYDDAANELHALSYVLYFLVGQRRGDHLLVARVGRDDDGGLRPL